MNSSYMKKIFLSLLVLLFLSASVKANGEPIDENAGSGIITGRVIDETDISLPGATIQIIGISKGTVTDIDGHFRIAGLPGNRTEFELTVSYVGYETVSRNIILGGNRTANIIIKMESNVVLDEVVVKGTTGGTLRAMNQQKNSDRIVNVISAEQVGSFPDPNIGDALKRISGVHVQYDQGEAKLVSVRGTDPSKSTISINGTAMPGTGDNRAVGVDAIPADMVQSIELSKTVTPDMDGDAIGGAINLTTRKAPYTRRLSLTAGSGYSFLTSGPQYNGALTYGERFVEDKLGIMLSASIYRQSFGSNKHESPWDPTNIGDKEHFLPDYLNIEQTLMDRLRQSYTLGLDYIFNQRHSLAFTGIYNDYKDWRKRYTLRIDDIGGNYKENWKKAAGYEDVAIYTDAEDYAAADDPVKVLDKNNDGVDDFTGNMYIDFDPLKPTIYPELERHVYAGENSNGGELTHKKIVNGALSGDHLIGKLRIDWLASVMRTTEDQPKLRDFELQSSNEKTVIMDYTDPRYVRASSGFTIDNIAQLIQGKNSAEVYKVDTWELDGFKGKIGNSRSNQQNYALNVDIPLIEGKFKNRLKLGGKARKMSKTKEIIGRVKWKPADDPAMPGEFNWAWMWNNFAQNMKDVSADFRNSKYSVGHSVDAKWVAGQNVDPVNGTKDWKIVTVYNNEMADGYKADEDIYSGYIMSTQSFGNHFSVIAGLRMEHTDIYYKGTEYTQRADVTDEVEVSTSYDSWLPGIHFRWAPEKRSVIRLAYSRTISRPDYRDLVPYVKSDIRNSTLKFGNPELLPTHSQNFDLLGERYLGSIGLISGGVYFKNIQDFRSVNYFELPWNEGKEHVPTIEEVSANPNADPKNVQTYIKDYNKAQNKPFKVEQPINGGNANLLGMELAFQRNLDFLGDFFRRFNLYANYTHNWVFDRNKEDDNARLVGTADDIANVSLSYETRKINARVSLNYTSDFLIGSGSTTQDYRYYDDVTYLDANLDYFVTQKLIIFASGNNLLNEIQRVYQWKKEYTVSALENGARFQVGIKYNIF